MDRHILLVDDDRDALGLLRILLERNGCKALTATGSREAIEILKKQYDEIDTVILDLMMPGQEDGYSVCEFLQQHNSLTREIPVIVLSAKSSPQDMARSFNTGAFQHITKPYDIHYLLAVIESMRRLKHIQDNARSTAEKFAVIFENSPLGAMVVDRDYRVLEVSRALRERFPNVTPDSGSKFYEVFYDPPRNEPHPDSPLPQTLKDGKIHRHTLTLDQGERRVYWDISAAPLNDKEGQIWGAILICADVTHEREMAQQLREENARANAAVERYREVLNHQDEITNRLIQTQRELKEKTHQLEKVNQLLEKLSITDELTGLFNRRYFNDAFESEVRRSIRYNHPLSLIILDIDHFKKVNDTHGHPIGDVVLKGISGLFFEQLRETDIIARYGGEEFAIVLPETTPDTAMMIAERLRERVMSEIFDADGLQLKITISLGVCAGFGEFNADRLLQCADEALYNAKEGGRNRVCQGKLK